jgi:hypothetical protein
MAFQQRLKAWLQIGMQKFSLLMLIAHNDQMPGGGQTSLTQYTRRLEQWLWSWGDDIIAAEIYPPTSTQ